VFSGGKGRCPLSGLLTGSFYGIGIRNGGGVLGWTKTFCGVFYCFLFAAWQGNATGDLKSVWGCPLGMVDRYSLQPYFK